MNKVEKFRLELVCNIELVTNRKFRKKSLKNTSTHHCQSKSWFVCTFVFFNRKYDFVIETYVATQDSQFFDYTSTKTYKIVDQVFTRSVYEQHI